MKMPIHKHGMLPQCRFNIHFLLIVIATFSAIVRAQVPVIDEEDRVVLNGNVSPLATARNDMGLSSSNLAMERITLLLRLRSGADEELSALLAKQHDASSPNYQHWLTPEQYGRRFGASASAISAVVNWLSAHGFVVEEVAPGKGWINFSGNAAHVEETFRTEIHDYLVDGKIYHANAVEPSIPRALTGVVHGVVALNNFPLRYDHKLVGKIDPGTTFTDGSHGIGPADFATIYNLKPLYSVGITGTPVTIAIVGRTDIHVSDVTTFRKLFGLPAKSPVIVHNGADPGDLGGEEEIEALLDTEWSGAVAKNATVKLVVSKTTASNNGVTLSAQYIVSHNLAPIMSTSFSQCEQNLGSTANAFWSNLWKQAASQGITAFVASGDSGAADCDSSSATKATHGRAVNGLCSPSSDVCVGGTEFHEGSNPSQYWSNINNPTTLQSVLKYIPEVVWNGSCTGLSSSGGGVSTIYAKPPFQVAPGVPAGTKRFVPDVSLTAACHDGYIVVQGGKCCFLVGGTSAASPSFAGLMALVVQKTGRHWGNADTVFYPMGKFQYTGGTNAVFHDIKIGNNSVPGVIGFSAITGYDAATGLGSVNAANMVNKWGVTH
jgi:pseudomonalisin